MLTPFIYRAANHMISVATKIRFRAWTHIITNNTPAMASQILGDKS